MIQMTEEQTAGQTPQAIDLMQFVPKVHFEQIPIRNLVSNQEYQRNLSQHHVLFMRKFMGIKFIPGKRVPAFFVVVYQYGFRKSE